MHWTSSYLPQITLRSLKNIARSHIALPAELSKDPKIAVKTDSGGRYSGRVAILDKKVHRNRKVRWDSRSVS